MGIQYRDYMRDDASRRFGYAGWQGRSMVQTLIIVNAVVFVLQTVVTYPVEVPEYGVIYESYLESWFALDPGKVLQGEIWRLTTYDFLHHTGGIWHILLNMLVLWMAGRDLEAVYGPREFLAFYLTAGVVSGIGFMLWGLYFGNLTPAIGASGAVTATMVVYAVKWPDRTWMIMGILPVPAWALAVFSALSDLHPMLLELGRRGDFRDGIAHSAHLAGMAFGLLYAQRNWHISGWVDLLPRFNWLKRRPKVRLHRPPADDLPPRREPVAAPSRARKEEVSERVDELLGKIAEQGEASLTDEERAFLADASRLYRSKSRGQSPPIASAGRDNITSRQQSCVRKRRGPQTSGQRRQVPVPPAVRRVHRAR
jgi:membrane associated rhomboid family serine protease